MGAQGPQPEQLTYKLTKAEQFLQETFTYTCTLYMHAHTQQHTKGSSLHWYLCSYMAFELSCSQQTIKISFQELFSTRLLDCPGIQEHWLIIL